MVCLCSPLQCLSAFLDRKVLALYQGLVIMAEHRMVVSDGMAVVMSICFYLKLLIHFRY